MRGATIHQPRMWIARLGGGFGHKVEGCNGGLCALSGPRPHKRCLCSLLSLLKWFGVECFMSRVRVFRWIWWHSQWEEHNVPVLSKLGWANKHMHTNECGSYVLFPPCFILISKNWMNLVYCVSAQNLKTQFAGHGSRPINATCGLNFAVSQKKMRERHCQKLTCMDARDLGVHAQCRFCAGVCLSVCNNRSWVYCTRCSHTA